MKPKLKIHVKGAFHFLGWELPFLEKNFRLIDAPSDDAVLLAFGPDVLESAIEMPAKRRVALLFPGFGYNPYHDLNYRRKALELIESYYDLVFVNPGPLEVAYGSSKKVRVCSYTINTKLITLKSYRKKIDSLLHVSADYPQKDWRRSAKIMELTGLRCEVYPSRNKKGPLSDRFKRRVNGITQRFELGNLFRVMPGGYVNHSVVVRKYKKFDGFVHVASEHNELVDGKYTSALLEAGATGAILFWHDTLGLGNHLETVFDLPLDPGLAAQEILSIRESINVESHSKKTRDEILDKFNPEKSINYRTAKIKELL